MFLSARRFFLRPRARRPSFSPQLESLEPRWTPSTSHHHLAHAPTGAFSGPVVHAINYSPTWQGFVPAGAFFDSDFASDATVALWGRDKGGKPELNPNA